MYGFVCVYSYMCPCLWILILMLACFPHRIWCCRFWWEELPPLQIQSKADEHLQRRGFSEVQEHAGRWGPVSWRRTAWRLYYPGAAKWETFLAHQPGFVQTFHLILHKVLPALSSFLTFLHCVEGLSAHLRVSRKVCRHGSCFYMLEDRIRRNVWFLTSVIT